MAPEANLIWDTRRPDRRAKWMFRFSAVLSGLVAIVALYQCELLTGVLGLAAALSGLAGGIAAEEGNRIRDERADTEALWQAEESSRNGPNP